MKKSIYLLVFFVFTSIIVNAQNLLKNAEFLETKAITEIPEHWRTLEAFSGKRVTDIEKEGQFCLKLNRLEKATKRNTFWIQTELPLQPERYYKVRYSAKTAKGNPYMVYVEWNKINKDGKEVYGGNATNEQVGTGGWQNISFNFSFPKDKQSPYFVLRGSPDADYLFRNLSIVEITDPSLNKLENADFTLQKASAKYPTSWNFRGSTTGKRIPDPEKEGDYCLQSTGEEKFSSKSNLWIQHGLKLIPGKRYTVNYSARVPKDQKCTAYVEWSKKGKEGKLCYGGNALSDTNGTNAWQTISFDFTLPQNAVAPYFVLRTPANTTCFFRNLSIKDFTDTIELKSITAPPSLVSQFKKEGFFTLDSSENTAVIESEIAKGFYTLRYSIIAETLTNNGGFPWVKVLVSVNSEQFESEWDDCLKTWQRKSFQFTASKNEKITIRFKVKDNGIIRIKDLFLTKGKKIKKEQACIFFDSPCYRNTFFNTEKPEIIGSIEKKNPMIKQYSFVLKDPQNKTIYHKNNLFDNDTIKFSIAIPNPLAGEYNLATTFFDSNNSILDTENTTITYCTQKCFNVRMRKDNTLLINDKPIFPLLLWKCPQTTEFLKTIKAAGFNCFMTWPNPAVLQQAENNNMKVICYVQHLVFSATKTKDKTTWEKYVRDELNEVCKSPAILAYFLVDEPLWGGKDLNELKELYELVKKIDPSRPIFINAAPRKTIAELAEYGKACDIYGVDIYPVPPPTGHSNLKDTSLSCVGKYCVKMRETVQDRKPIIMTLQGFSWAHFKDRTSKNAVYPTWSQMRFMAYDSIVHGAKGLAIWGTPYIVDANADFWKTIFSVISEIKFLEPVLTSEQIPEIKANSSTPAIKLMTRNWKNQLYIFAVNLQNAPVSTNIDLAHFDGK
ncbi:MAG: carbohydrate binding domain-containing protein, partial [Lentisphaeria bacterium]